MVTDTRKPCSWNISCRTTTVIGASLPIMVCRDLDFHVLLHRPPRLFCLSPFVSMSRHAMTEKWYTYHTSRWFNRYAHRHCLNRGTL